jgi:hypothetical protein
MDQGSLKFVLRDAVGNRRELGVDSDIARVGSGAHCEIRLPPEQAAPEQLRVEARSGGVFAEVRSLTPPTLLNGLPFTQGRLLPESRLQIGDFQISVVTASSGSERRAKPERQASRSKFVYALGAIGFPLGIWVLLTTEPQTEAAVAPVAPPALFVDEPSTCSESTPSTASSLAVADLERADSSRERAPFDAERGVNAVALYQRAAACFRTAEQPADAKRAGLASDALKRKLNQEFRLHQVRLEWAQATHHYAEARTEVRLLLSFVGHRGAEYVAFLSALDRQFELKNSGPKE